MRTTDYMLKYFGEGNLSAFDKIAPAFEKELNAAIKYELKQSLNTKPTARDKEIAEILRKEKEEYEIKKKAFYDNPLHWSNNKRKMHGLPVLRGRLNKCRSKKFPSFKPTQRVFFLIEDIIEETLCENLKEDKFFNKFVDVKNVRLGEQNTFYY